MASCASPVVPISPLGAAIDAIDGFTGEERDVFFSSLDQLPNFDSPTPPAPEDNRFSYDIEEDDWKWLATQVGGRTQQELAQFAHAEYERMALEDPDLVRAPPHAALYFFVALRHSLPYPPLWRLAPRALGAPYGPYGTARARPLPCRPLGLPPAHRLAPVLPPPSWA